MWRQRGCETSVHTGIVVTRSNQLELERREASQATTDRYSNVCPSHTQRRAHAIAAAAAAAAAHGHAAAGNGTAEQDDRMTYSHAGLASVLCCSRRRICYCRRRCSYSWQVAFAFN